MEKLIEFNGEIVAFPDSMSDAEIEKVLSQQSVPDAPEKQFNPLTDGLATRGVVGILDAMKTIGSGAVGGFAGGLTGAGSLMTENPMTPTSEAMDRAAGRMESVQDKFQLQPSTDVGRRILGGIAPVAEKIDTGLTDAFDKVPGPPGVKAAARTAVQGPLEILGLRGVGAVAQNAVKPKATSFIPEIDDLYNVGRVAFNEARINGGSLRPEKLESVANSLTSLRNEAGLRIDFDPDLHPQAYSLRNRIMNELQSGDVDFDSLLTLRQLAGEVAGNKAPGESMRGVKLKKKIDDFVDNLKPEDVMSGNPAKAAQALEQARKFWRDASAARTIDEQIKLAELDAGDTTGAGFENKLRIRFRQLARRIEKGQEKGFTPDEVKLIKTVAQGTPIGNVFRQFGKFSPAGVVSTAGGAYLGSFLGGPIGVAGVLGAGALGRKLATNSTISNAQRALEAPLRRSLLQ